MGTTKKSSRRKTGKKRGGSERGGPEEIRKGAEPPQEREMGGEGETELHFLREHASVEERKNLGKEKREGTPEKETRTEKL